MVAIVQRGAALTVCGLCGAVARCDRYVTQGPVLVAAMCPDCAAAGPVGAVKIALARVARLQGEIGRLLTLVGLLVVRGELDGEDQREGATHKREG